MELIGLLERNRTAIVDDALAAMQRAGLQHYRDVGREASRGRLEALYDVLCAAIAGRTLMPVETHAETVARERFLAGFGLGEVQTAFNVLEEAAWTRIETQAPAEELGRSLAMVSTVLGAGKDQLARTYVSLATQTNAPAIDVKALFTAASR